MRRVPITINKRLAMTLVIRRCRSGIGICRLETRQAVRTQPAVLTTPRAQNMWLWLQGDPRPGNVPLANRSGQMGAGNDVSSCWRNGFFIDVESADGTNTLEHEGPGGKTITRDMRQSG